MFLIPSNIFLKLNDLIASLILLIVFRIPSNIFEAVLATSMSLSLNRLVVNFLIEKLFMASVTGDINFVRPLKASENLPPINLWTSESFLTTVSNALLHLPFVRSLSFRFIASKPWRPEIVLILAVTLSILSVIFLVPSLIFPSILLMKSPTDFNLLTKPSGNKSINNVPATLPTKPITDLTILTTEPSGLVTASTRVLTPLENTTIF